MKRVITASILLALCVSGFLWAQTSSTSILGTVTDPSGAVVVGARVTLLNVQTGIKSVGVTTSSGDYNFPLLNPGEYAVTVEAPGFKTFTRTGIHLELDLKARIDAHMEVGTAQQTVEVTSQGALLQTDQATLGQVMNQQSVQELPLNGRNIGALAALQPGVQYGGRMGLTNVNAGGGGGVPIPGDAITISANGQRDTDFHATLDGVAVTEARVDTMPFTPSPEAIGEFKVLAGNYSAEYGTNSGGQLVMNLRSGTNQFHGDAFEFLRNDKFDATDYFQNYFNAPGAPAKPKNLLRQNQYGGVFSGPLIIPKVYNGKDRTFFMFDYEGRKLRQPNQVGQQNAPTDAFENGDLSALLNRRGPSGNPLPSVQVIDPITGIPFANNQIPASRISPAAKSLFQFWPKPQFATPDPISGFNYIGVGDTSINDDQRFLRIDHQINDNDRIFGHYVFEDISYSQHYGDNPNFPYFVAGRNQSAAIQWVHIFTPTVINEFRLGYMRSTDNTLNPRSNTNFSMDALGFTGFHVINDNNRPFTPREAGLPNFSISGFGGLGDRDGGNGFDYNNQYEIGDNLNLTRGAHNFKMGFAATRVWLDRGAANVPRGDESFTDNIANSGWASFLLGYPIGTDSPEGIPLTYPRQNRYGAYFQDDWKVSQRLTLNLGLRYEYNTTAVDSHGLWRSLSFATVQNGYPSLIPNIRTPYSFYSPDSKDFAPRVGLAYRLGEKTVIRTGAGIYYNVQQLNNYTILNLNPPLSGSTPFTNTASNGVIVNQNPYTLANPFGTINSKSAINANTLNPNNFEPKIYQWSFGVQRQLPWQSVLDVSYVGSKGTHIDNTVELNNPDPGLSSLPTTPQQRRPWQYVTDGFNGPVRPLSRIRWLDSGANSWYNGLQVNWQKRLTSGLTANLAYTWSKSEGEGYGRNEGFGFTQNGSYQNPRNRAADKARYPFDVTHNLVASWLYALPAPPGLKHGVGYQVFGGWQINGIWTIHTGLPFTVSQGNTLNTISSPVRPDRLATGTLSNPTINQWFNPNAFQVVTCQSTALANLCHYGNAGNGILTGPSFHNLDFSLFKNFPIHESMKLQFRAEFFNVFNSPNFNPPNSSLNASPAFLPSGPGGAFPSQIVAQGPGQITSLAAPMRQVQFALKFLF
ncbi:MAG TPA: carboxypeptidase regulatory-like domain-containing protein [Bryobacteraceae bacterium]|nr:carboxypeptidase regulatory-like domain-containing protein [Bryobacteraceae bacterium]